MHLRTFIWTSELRPDFNSTMSCVNCYVPPLTVKCYLHFEYAIFAQIFIAKSIHCGVCMVCCWNSWNWSTDVHILLTGSTLKEITSNFVVCSDAGIWITTYSRKLDHLGSVKHYNSMPATWMRRVLSSQLPVQKTLPVERKRPQIQKFYCPPAH